MQISQMTAAQPGSLDGTFGINGIVITSIDSFGAQVNSIAQQGDQKIIFGGFSRSSFVSKDFALARSNADGTLDNTFGLGGIVITPIEPRSEGSSLAIQNDGKIIVGGFSDWFINIARYTVDGILDSTFGNGGIVITDLPGFYSERCKSVAIQSDGKILLGGYAQHNNNDNSYFILLRYNEDGTLDSSFGTEGQVVGIEGRCYSIAVQSDGKILLGGSSNLNFAVARYTTTGLLDNTFGQEGIANTVIGNSSEANSIAIQSDGNILLGGYSYSNNTSSDFTLARYNLNGVLDNTFGTNGIVITSFGNASSIANAIGLEENGKIIMAGNSFDDSNFSGFALVQYESNGSLDASFGNNGKVITSIESFNNDATSLTVQNDGKVVLGGYTFNTSTTEMMLVRYEVTQIEGIDEIGNDLGIRNFHPNPHKSSAILNSNSMLNNAELIIYNSEGQQVSYLRNLNGTEIQIPQNKMPSGIYFLHLIEGNKTIAIERLIISE